MFAVVRTGGKQYRVSAGDKIAIEKIVGEAGDIVSLSDVLFASDGGVVTATAGLAVSAEIVAQAKTDKIIVFKKKRRHNYRRKAGHRQQVTLLKITAIGDVKATSKKAAAAPLEVTPVEAAVEAKPAKKPAAKKAAPAAE